MSTKHLFTWKGHKDLTSVTIDWEINSNAQTQVVFTDTIAPGASAGINQTLLPGVAGIDETIIGGFILGPVVQKYSFGQFWTGWPLGNDLTDNKTLFALIAFVAAWFLRNKSYGRWLAVGAALVMMAVYLIPHSMGGSELDRDSGEVVTGSILALMGLSKFRK